MNRTFFYLIGVALILSGMVVYLLKRWGAIDFVVALILLTIIIFLLYVFSLFLISGGRETLDDRHPFHTFLKRRWLSITLFLASLIILALLIFVSHP